MYHKLALGCALWMLLACSADTAGDPGDGVIAAQLDGVIAGLPVEVRAVADRIPDLGRRLLATRAYLRGGDSLASRWSWSEAQYDAFAISSEGAALRSAIAVVRCAFETRNPGHSLRVNQGFRSVEIQLERWNSNESVAQSAAHLLQVARAAIGMQSRPPDREGVARLGELLRNHAPQPMASLAAPGLSAHGRGNAVDFQVLRAGSVVAGPDAASVDTVWDAGGWTQRLGAAIKASGAPFDGPLLSPREPWHYSYVPATQPNALVGCDGMDAAHRGVA